MALLLGKTLKNRYRVDEFLGRGGMAEVYKVWDTQRGVPLAMKVLRDDLAEDIVFMRRFEREAQNLTRLQHPNIVRCYGLEQEGRTAFMLMDYIEGGTLRSEIFDAHGSLTMQRILEIMQPVCSALSYAHQMGMVHCDVKSANIMIHKNGTVYLADFGIARGMDAGTSTMVGMGTPAYMAPELIKGQDPTPQTDIYALGIVLYEMLTGGERPFTGERATITGTTAEKVRWEHLKLEPIKLRSFNPDVTVELSSSVLTCLEKSPQKRYQSISELSTKMQNALSQKQGGLQQEEGINNDLDVNVEKSIFDQREEGDFLPHIPSSQGFENKVRQQADQDLKNNQKKISPNVINYVTIIAIALMITILALFMRNTDSSTETKPVATKIPTPEATKIPTATVVPQPVVASAEQALIAFQNSSVPVASTKTIMSGSHPLLFSAGWWTVDNSTLDQNLQYVDWDFYLNQNHVSQDLIASDITSAEDGIGKQNFMYIYSWPEGNHTVEIYFNIYETIYDGWDEYETQQTTYLYDISVTSGRNGTDFQEWPIVYHETFLDDNGDWWTGISEEAQDGYDGEYKIENGYYVIEVQSGNDSISLGVISGVTSIGDFYLSAEIGTGVDSEFNGCYSLQFLDNYYFDVCSDQEYGVYYSGEDFEWIINWTEASNLNGNDKNEISVLKMDNKLTFFINGIEQATVDSFGEEAGRMGVGIDTWIFPSSFYFDEITIRMP